MVITVGGPTFDRGGSIIPAANLLTDSHIHNGIVAQIIPLCGVLPVAQVTISVDTQHLHGGIVLGSAALILLVIAGVADGCSAGKRRQILRQFLLYLYSLDTQAFKVIGAHIELGIHFAGVGVVDPPVKVLEASATCKGTSLYSPDAAVQRETGKGAAKAKAAVAGINLHAYHRQGIAGEGRPRGIEAVGRLYRGGQLQYRRTRSDLAQAGGDHRAPVAVGGRVVQQTLIVAIVSGTACHHQVIQFIVAVVLPGEGLLRCQAAEGQVDAQQAPGILAPGPQGAVPAHRIGDPVAGDHLGIGHDGLGVGVHALIVYVYGQGTPNAVGTVYHIDDRSSRPGLGGGDGDLAVGVGRLGNGNNAGIAAKPVEVGRVGRLDRLIPVKVIALIALLHHLGGIDAQGLTHRHIHLDGEFTVGGALAVLQFPAPCIIGGVLGHRIHYLSLDIGVGGADDGLTAYQSGLPHSRSGSVGSRIQATGGDLHQVGHPAAHQQRLGFILAHSAHAQLTLIVFAPGVEIAVHSGNYSSVAAGAEVQYARQIIGSIHRLNGAATGVDPDHRVGDGPRQQILVSFVDNRTSLFIAKATAHIYPEGINCSRIGEESVVHIAGGDLADSFPSRNIDLSSGRRYHIIAPVAGLAAGTTTSTPLRVSCLITAPGIEFPVGQILCKGQGQTVGFTSVDGNDPLQAFASLFSAPDPNRSIAVLPVFPGIRCGIVLYRVALAQLIANAFINQPANCGISIRPVIAIADPVLAPGKHFAVRAQSHGELSAGGNGHHPVQIMVTVGGIVGHKVSHGRLTAHHVDGDHAGSAGGIVVTQLAVGVVAPGPDGTVAVQSHRMIPTRGDSYNEGSIEVRIAVLVISLVKGHLYRYHTGARHHIGIVAPGPDLSIGVQGQAKAVLQMPVSRLFSPGHLAQIVVCPFIEGLAFTSVFPGLIVGAVIITAACGYGHDVGKELVADQYAVTAGLVTVHPCHAIRIPGPAKVADITLLLARQNRGGEGVTIVGAVTVAAAGNAAAGLCILAIAPGPNGAIGLQGQVVGARRGDLRYRYVLHVPLLQRLSHPADIEIHQQQIAFPVGGGITDDHSGRACLLPGSKGDPVGALAHGGDPPVQDLDV